MVRHFLLIAAAITFTILLLIPISSRSEDSPSTYESVEVLVEFENEGVDFSSPNPLYPPNESEIVNALYTSAYFEQDANPGDTLLYIVDIDTTGLGEPVLNSGPIPPDETDDIGWDEHNQ